MYNFKQITSVRFAVRAGLLISLLCLLITLVLRFQLAFSTSTDLAGVEQNVIYSIQTILHNGTLYTDSAKIPFSVTQYTPLYLYLCALTAFICNLNPLTDIHQLYIIGRLWNIAFNLLSALAIYQIGFKFLKLQKFVALILAISTFCIVFKQGYSVRPDSMQDAMLLVSIYFFTSFVNQNKGSKRKMPALFIAVIISVATIFVKQSALQLPLIFLAFLLFVGDWRALLYATFASIITFCAFLLLFIYLYGDAFIQNVVGGVANGISLEWFEAHIWGKSFVVKIIFPALIAAAISFRKLLVFRGKSLDRFFCFCTAGLFTFASVTILKNGSNIQYYYVFSNIALLLIFYYFFTKIKSQPHSKFNYREYIKLILIAVIVGMTALTVQHFYAWIQEIEYDQKDEKTQKDDAAFKAADYMNKYVLKPNDLVFANLDIESILREINGRRGMNNVLFRNCVVPQLEIYENSTGRSAVFGYETFEHSLRTGRIKYIIESDPVYKFSIIDDLRKIEAENFHLIKKIGPYSIYQYNYNTHK